jgi:hypothetical protein
VAAARAHVDELESGHGLLPDQAAFQTWDLHPTRVLPVASDATLGSLVGYYLRPKSKLVAARSPTAVNGRLEGAGGEPIAGARILLAVLGSDLSRPPPIRIATGTVPATARSAIIGMRVNTECNCAGNNDLVVGVLTYSETGNGHVRISYDVPAEAQHLQAGAGPGPVIRAGTVGTAPIARVVVPADQHFGFNSATFPVTPGASFRFSVPLGAVGDSGLFGSVTLIWLDADQHGLFRTDVLLPSDVANIATTTSDADGRFSFASTDVEPTKGRPVRLEFNDSAPYRKSITYIR